jgi:type III secretion protein Q
VTLEQAYIPPPLNFLEAQFLNELLTRDLPHAFDLFGKPCSFKADPWQPPFAPACGLRLEIWGETWQALFSSRTLMGLHPAGACIAESSDLPEALRLALFELSLAPVLRLLADFLALDKPPAIIAEMLEITDEFSCSIPLALCLPGEDIAVTLYIPGRDSAEALLRRLGQERHKRNPVPALFLSVGLEAGAMRLTVPELSALEPEDILLPETYPGRQGQLCLRLSPDMTIRCAVDNGRATVIGLDHGLPWPAEQEKRREKMADTPPDAAPQEEAAVPVPQAAPETGADMPRAEAASPERAISLDTLEVTVTFELDRRLMSVAEIAALAPGYTFTLPADPNAPVNIRANGKSLGTGRLVDVGGVLGVQLVSLKQGK